MDLALSENVNRLEAFANNLITKGEEYITKTSEFFGSFSRGELPQNKLYTEILFRNILNVPFAEQEDSDALRYATKILFALTAFPTTVPRAFEVASEKYMECLVDAINSNNRNMIKMTFELMNNLLNQLHEHKGYEYRDNQNNKKAEPSKDKYKKEKKFREVS